MRNNVASIARWAGLDGHMTLERAIADFPRWMFLCILAFAPLAYGCTRPLTIIILNEFAAVLALCWVAGCVWLRRWPALPWLPTVLVTLLLIQGWWLAWNAYAIHADITTTTFFRIWDYPPLPGWSGAVDRRFSHFSMLNVTALLVLFVFACDLMRQSVWRKRVWVTMALTAFAVVLFGTALKLGGPKAREWIWDPVVAQLQTTFAGYRYHGNAASLMSIGWALVLGFVAVAASRRRQSLLLAGWVVVLLGLLLGLFLNTSRAGWGLALFVACVVGARFAWAWWHQARQHFDWKLGTLQFGLIAGTVAVLMSVGLGANWNQNLGRLTSAVQAAEQRYPAPVYQQLAKETELFGAGADCFSMALPPYMKAFGMADEKFGFWRDAHNDYYQYFIEWGWSGFICWTVLILGGLGRGLREHFSSPVIRDSTQWMLGFCGCAAMLGILLHARWDFPLEIASIRLYFLTLLADAWARHSKPDEALSPDVAGHSISD